MLTHQDAVEVRHRRHALRRLAAGLLHRVLGEAPLVEPLVVERLLVVARLAPLAQARQQLLERALAPLVDDHELFDVLRRAHAALRPVASRAVRYVEGEAPAALLDLHLQQHQHDLLGQLQHVHPVEDLLIVRALGQPVAQDAAHLLGEAAVVELLTRVLRARERELLDVHVGVTDRVVAHLTHQPVARPVAEGVLHVLLRHVEVARHAGERHTLLIMIADHQPIEVDLHIVARRAQHVLGDEHVLHRRHIKPRRTPVKRTKRHDPPLFPAFA